MEDRVKLQSEQPLFGPEFVLDTSQTQALPFEPAFSGRCKCYRPEDRGPNLS